MVDRNDADLIALARAGDRAAFGRLIERHQLMVKRIAAKMVRNEHLAQELTQEALLQAYLSLDQLRDDGRFQSWLYGITLNVCKSYLRMQKVNLLSWESLMGGTRVDPAVLSRSAPDPDMVIEQRELHRLVLDAVNTLSPRNRAATLLFYFDQLTIQEIAGLLGISMSAVKVRLHRSRQQLRFGLASLEPKAAQAIQPLSTTDPVDIIPERKTKMVKVTVADVIQQRTQVFGIPLEETGTNFLVVLLDKSGKRLLPIWIGAAEGMAMALNLIDVSFPRPVTFTFISNLLQAGGIELEKVSVSALEGDTYYAAISINVSETTREIDARPSDGINLALQMGCPIYVAESVMEKASIDISDQDALPKGRGLQELQQEWDERMQRGEENRRALREKFAGLSDEERDEYTAQNLAWILGAES